MTPECPDCRIMDYPCDAHHPSPRGGSALRLVLSADLQAVLDAAIAEEATQPPALRSQLRRYFREGT